MIGRNLMIISYLKSKRFLLPTLLCAAFVCILLVLMSSGQHKYNDIARTLIQWDGQHYLSIARDGYEKFPCAQNRTFICGNIGWFPGYPLVAKPLITLGIPAPWAMILVSWLCLWGGLLLMYRLVEETLGTVEAGLSIAALLSFPSSFYLITAFPYAQFFVLSVVVLWLLKHQRYHWLWLPTGMLAVTYPSGVVIGLPVAFHLVLSWKKLTRKQRAWLMGSLAAIGLALTMYFGYYWWRFDDFLLYNRFQGQAYYAHEPAFPLVPLYEALTTLPTSHPVFVILIVAWATLAVFFTTRLPWTWIVLGLGILLFTPSFGTTDCYYRHIVVAFPLPVLAACAWQDRWRRYLLPIYAGVGIYLTLSMFLKAFKLGQLM